MLETSTPSNTADLIRRAVRLKVRCSQACEVRVKLKVSRPAAHQLGIGTAIVDVSRVRSRGGHPLVIFAKLGSRAARALGRSKLVAAPRVGTSIRATPVAGDAG